MSDLFPGKYYLKAVLKEYTFESSNKEVTVNEGNNIFSSLIRVPLFSSSMDLPLIDNFSVDEILTHSCIRN